MLLYLFILRKDFYLFIDHSNKLNSNFVLLCQAGSGKKIIEEMSKSTKKEIETSLSKIAHFLKDLGFVSSNFKSGKG